MQFGIVMAESVILTIEDESGLRMASAILHRAFLRHQDVHFDPTRNTLCIGLWRQVPELRRSKRVLLICEITKYLHARYMLSLSRVKPVNMRIHEVPDYYLVDYLKHDRTSLPKSLDCLHPAAGMRWASGGEITWRGGAW